MDINKTPKLVVAINGVGGTGKDTFCDYCADISHSLDLGVSSMSSMDQIKEIAKKLGWDGVSKTSKDRKFLSDLKDLSTEYNDGPFEYIKSRVNKMSHDIMFIHIRETAEIDKVKNYVESISNKGYRFMSVRVNRSVGTETNNTGDLNATLPYPYSLEINNDGTLAELQDKANEFMFNSAYTIQN